MRSRFLVVCYLVALIFSLSTASKVYAYCDPLACVPSDLDCIKKDIQSEIADYEEQKKQLLAAAKIIKAELDKDIAESLRLKQMSNDISKDMTAASYIYAFGSTEASILLTGWVKALRGATLLISRLGKCGKQCSSIWKASRAFKVASKTVDKGQISFLAQLGQIQQCDDKNLANLGGILLIPGGLEGAHCATKAMVLDGLNQMIGFYDDIISDYSWRLMTIKSEFKFIDKRLAELRRQLQELKCGDDLR